LKLQGARTKGSSSANGSSMPMSRSGSSLYGYAFFTCSSGEHPEGRWPGTDKRPGHIGRGHPLATDGQTASLHGMGSLDGRCLIERRVTSVSAGQCLCGAPPESNRRPHPYHGTTRNRCANPRFPRLRPTVGPKLSVLFRRSYALSSKHVLSSWSKPESAPGESRTWPSPGKADNGAQPSPNPHLG
jgi:hypothetical protein